MARNAEERVNLDHKPAWFCIRSHPKREHIAAAHLVTQGTEVYLPRIRFRRGTRRGSVWFTEALFPNYLFARFQPEASLRRVRHAAGVLEVVHFGNQWPTVPDEVIEALRALVGGGQPQLVRQGLQPGENVTIAGGLFHGFEGVVTRVMPGSQRVAVLLEFLGTQTAVELPIEKAICEEAGRRSMFGNAPESL